MLQRDSKNIVSQEGEKWPQPTRSEHLSELTHRRHGEPVTEILKLCQALQMFGKNTDGGLGKVFAQKGK